MSVFVLVKINRDAVVVVGPGLGYESSSLATGCGQLLSSKKCLAGQSKREYDNSSLFAPWRRRICAKGVLTGGHVTVYTMF